MQCKTIEKIEKVASENAVVIFSRTSCCMCHAIERLFYGMGVNPTVHELSEDVERAFLDVLSTPDHRGPVVFIGGQLIGPMDRLVAAHINGSLVPLLKRAGALWL